MSFGGNYPNRKDWLKPYYGSKAFDPSCRDGNCPWCRRVHEYKEQLLDLEAEEQIQEIKED